GEDLVGAQPRSTRDHRRSPLISTMSCVAVTRVTARRLPSRDQANTPIRWLSVKWVNWVGGPPSTGAAHRLGGEPSTYATPAPSAVQLSRVRVARGAGRVRSDAQSGRSQITTSGRCASPIEPNMRRRPSGEIDGVPTANRRLNWRGAPPSIDMAQIDWLLDTK